MNKGNETVGSIKYGTTTLDRRRLDRSGGLLRRVTRSGAHKGAADDLVRRLALKRGGVPGVHKMSSGAVGCGVGHTATSGRTAHCTQPAWGRSARSANGLSLPERQSTQLFRSRSVDARLCPALASTISELRLEGIASGELSAIGEPGADLAVLLETYAQELAAQALADLDSLQDR